MARRESRGGYERSGLDEECRRCYRCRGCPTSCLLYQACNGESGQSNQLISFTLPRLKCGKGSVLLLVWASTQRRVTWSRVASSSAVRREHIWKCVVRPSGGENYFTHWIR